MDGSESDIDSHIITRMLLDVRLRIFAVFIRRSDIQTCLVFCEVSYAGHSVLWFVQ
jgi:hypothetical protein